MINFTSYYATASVTCLHTVPYLNVCYVDWFGMVTNFIFSYSVWEYLSQTTMQFKFGIEDMT